MGSANCPHACINLKRAHKLQMCTVTATTIPGVPPGYLACLRSCAGSAYYLQAQHAVDAEQRKHLTGSLVCVICSQAQHATDADQRKHEASAHAELERMGDAREPVRPPRPPGAPKVQLASFNDTEIVALAKGAQGGEDGVTAQAAVRAAERAAARAKERGA